MSRKVSLFHKWISVGCVLCFFSIAFLLHGATHAATASEENTVSETNDTFATSPEEDTASETDATSVENTTESTDSKESIEEAISSDNSTMSMVSSEDDPDGTGGISASNIQISGASGAVISEIPIIVPPGRNGMAPNLALVYNSYHKNGWVGVGWDLDMGSIQRSTKWGVNYDGTDFVASINGSNLELVPDSLPFYYVAKIEETFSRYYWNPGSGGWEVTTKDGTTYYYGEAPDSRQDNASGVFKWCLNRVEDTNGNFMTVTYTKDQGEIYLNRIDYTGSTTLAAANYVTFHLEDHTDAPPMYTTNAEVKTAKRLKRIEAYGNGLLARKYELEHDADLTTPGLQYSPGASVSLLGKLTQYGDDGLSELPAHRFTYFSDGDGTFAPIVSDTHAGGAWSTQWKILPADYNGDGRTDLCTSYTDGSGWRTHCVLSNADGTFAPIISDTHATGGWSTDWKILPADYNGDGRTDLCASYTDGSGWRTHCALSNGDGTFAPIISDTHATGGWSTDWKILPADYNGDGRTDLCASYTDGSGWRTHCVLSNGDGSFAPIVSDTHATGGWSTNWKILAADYNGDGRTDLCASYTDGSGWRTHCVLSSGDGTFAPIASDTHTTGVWSADWKILPADYNGDGRTDLCASYTDGSGWHTHCVLSNGDGTFAPIASDTHTTGDWSTDWKILPADYNGDGRTDLCASYTDGSGWHTHCVLSNGDGTFAPVTSDTHTTGALNTDWKILSVDYNGDGRTDLCASYTDGSGWRTHCVLSNGQAANLLSSISNPFGGAKNLEYAPSSHYQNTLLPFILNTVSSITTNDGLGNSSTMNYSYAGGLYDYAEREFRGFENLTQTNPNRTISETWYHQDEYRKGKAYATALLAPDETFLTQTVLTWDTVSLNPPDNTTRFVKMTQKLLTYDATGAYGQEDFIYDDTNGNLQFLVRSGTDAETVTTSYQYENYGDLVWRMTQQAVAGSESGKVREDYFDYEPGTGNMLWKEQWLDDGVNPRVNMTYDDYGNLETETDPKGHTTTIIYDDETKTYPVQKILPQTGEVAHVYEYEWDKRYGKLDWQKDENLNVTDYTYDVYGRPDQVDYPDGGQQITEYHDEVFPRYVLTKVKEKTAGYIRKYTYVDGLGRPIQSVGFGENGQSIVTRDYYDEMGRNNISAGPFFATGAGYPMALPAQYPWVQRNYDYRSRPLEVISNDSQHGNLTTGFSYSGFATTITDPDDRRKTEKKDYLGRLVEVTEQASDGDYLTKYKYNAAGDLATVTDHLGNITDITYDTLGRKYEMTDPDMGFWSYRYDANDNLLTQTDAKGQTITFAYDELDRLLSKTYSTGETPVIYAYDLATSNGKGRLFSVNRGALKTFHILYDAMGRVKKQRRTLDGTLYLTLFNYDLSGKLTRLTYPGGFYANYTYLPGTGLLDRVTGSDLVEYARISQYSPFGQIGLLESANGTDSFYNYDPTSGRLLSLLTEDPSKNPEHDLQGKVYTYTKAGDIETITDELWEGAGITYTYTYDNLHRMLTETNNGGQDALTYQYNAIGNIQSRQLGANTLGYTYDLAHKHAVKTVTSNGQVKTFVYDANGNMTTGFDFTDPADIAKRTFTYNTENLPTKIIYTKGGNTATTTFAYDGDGVRTKKIVQGGATTYYIGEHYEVAGGAPTLYIFAGNQRIAKITGTDKHYFHQDHLGSSTTISDASGAAVETAEYLAFGAMREHSGSTVSNYKYTGQELDPETGLYNYKARLYDPLLGRFITADTIVPGFADPQALNRYAYVKNKPVLYIDPDGHHFDSWGPGGDIDFGENDQDFGTSDYDARALGETDDGLSWGEYYGNDPFDYALETLTEASNWDAMSTVTVWADNTGIFGHSWITLEIPHVTGGIPEHWGNYIGIGPVHVDITREPTSMSEFNTFNSIANEIRTQFSRPDYGFFDDNCTDRVEEALDMMHVEHPSFDTLGISDPDRVHDWLRSL